MVTYDAFGRRISGVSVAIGTTLVNSFVQPTLGTVIPAVATPIPANPAVQERMRELREKEAAAKADAEKMEQLRIDGIQREVEAKSVEWEAELFFELEKTYGFMEWLRGKLQSPSAVQEASRAVSIRSGVHRRAGPDGKPEFYIPVLTLYDLAYNVIAEIEINRGYTLENERARLRYRVLAGVIASVKEAIRAEELAEGKRLAEVARIAAEEKAAAAEAWKQRRQAVLDRYADDVRRSMKTPYHSFMGVDPSNPFVMYVRYDVASKILSIENLRIDASDTKIDHLARIACPPTMKAPVTWNDMFEKGRLPFLTCCPVCSAQVTLSGINSAVESVVCHGHYRWDPATNLHYKIPPRGVGMCVPWDPRDPDGSIAARAARDKKIAETEAEIARLQTQLETLKRT
jgi:hypothetical protein